MKIKLSVAFLFLMFAASAFGKTTGLPFIQDNYAKALAEAGHTVYASMRDIEMIGTDTNLDRLSHEPSAAACVP